MGFFFLTQAFSMDKYEVLEGPPIKQTELAYCGLVRWILDSAQD